MALESPPLQIASSVTSPRPFAVSRVRGGSGWKAILVLAALVGVWTLEAAHYSHEQLSFIVPYPNKVWSEGFANAQSRSQIFTALGHSVEVVFVGLAIAIILGTLWAIIMSQARWAEQALFPYAVVLQCIPILALVPLISALDGFGFKARIIVTVMISLFPIVANTLFGLQSVDKGQRELFKLAGAGRLTMLRKLLIPAALPSIFVGLRTSAGLSVIGAIVADQFFQRGSTGLGVLIEVDNSRLLGPQEWAAIIVASLLGVLIFLLFGLLGRLVVGRWHDFS
jgi:NitT/TauT family transport system permease protein